MDKIIVVVTGANKGLGLAMVKGLCDKTDWIVYLTSRDVQRGLEACKQLEILKNKPKYHQLDITNETSIDTFYNYIKNTYDYVNLLVNNAGVLFLKDTTDTKLFQAQQTMLVNFFSLVNFTEKMLPIIKYGGKIINISSSSGHLSRIPSANLRNKLINAVDNSVANLLELVKEYAVAVQESKAIERGWGDSPYVVSKVGVNAYTFILDRILRDRDIRVNCVHPGYVKSDMTRGAGTVTPDVAAMTPLYVALECNENGVFMWHDRTIVPWDGPDPRGFIDEKI